MTIDQFQSLKCWQGPITLEPVSGGITNRNYLVKDDGSSYLLRVCEDRSLLGIDRRNERICQQAAHRAGISPAVVHFEDGILVSDFVIARTLAVDDVRNPDMVQRLAGCLRQLHGARDQLVGEMLYFCPFQTVRTYTFNATGLQAELPPDIDALLDDARSLASELRPFHPVLCHNDLLAANMLDDGVRLWLVDWEYAGIGNPLFDLASVSANCGLPAELERLLLESYFGTADSQTIRELRILKTVSLLREALWAVIQTVASEIEFNYVRYAAENLAAFREARSQLAKC